MLSDYVPRLLTMPPEQLERFVASWLSIRSGEYVDWDICAASGDGGRDVVGFETDQGYEGSWHNYQCKQLRRSLSVPEAVLELGKIFMHVARGDFTLPTRYVLVAPGGINRALADLIRQPERFRRTVADSWDATCRARLVQRKAVPLSPEIRAVVDAFDFAGISALDGPKLVTQPDIHPVLVHFFGADPGPPPEPTEIPIEIAAEESSYLGQLAAAYGGRAGLPAATTGDILAHPRWGVQMRDQRVRYFHAMAFGRHYRRRVFKEVLVAFDEEIYHGIVDTHRDDRHPDVLEQVNAVMRLAPTLILTGPLKDHASPQVKQGTCHRFANEDRLPWGI
ncbi:hypothetical protein QO001_003893 [Methylobacterium brachiatum]|uniref:ABC-three component systems C-terminal domain-containing protein n=1 Tax=Methylobacterium brachiatum TaxID=269660 RepID=A0AAJ1TQ04_9HYPH|nr:ABC-three component system protein [Methylobacterium brachiatum]MCB4806088.1 hypothetical protein [Methylobacterium brachiatum]MDQ0544957.1 hypothetical protein [Methylobacterium brachiatum]